MSVKNNKLIVKKPYRSGVSVWLLILLAALLSTTHIRAQNNSTVTAGDASKNSRVINKVRLWHSRVKTRVVFDVSNDVQHKVFRLSAPDRLVVDIENAQLSDSLPSIDQTNKHVKAIRSGRPKAGTLRFVMELKTQLQETSFVLTPNELYGYRLVIDLVDESAEQQAVTGLPDAESNVALNTIAPQPQATVEPAVLKPIEMQIPIQGKITIAIDAGHGGEDPGAIGFRGSHEKKITLEIAKRLMNVINQDPKMQAFLVREGDYYIDLHKRRQMARAKAADIFVSIHADAFMRSSANGLSVFALSQRGATSAMARALAAKENASDLIGGVSLANKDEVLAKVLVDLSMTNTISESVNLGGRVLRELSKVGRLHSKRVEQAGFAVLKSPDIPSILVETGFITNPAEEKKLRTSSYQNKIANAIYTAISEYYEQTPYYNTASYSSPSIAAGSSTASNGAAPRFHKVVRGDTLSEIAQKYGTSVSQIKALNNLRSNTAMLGQRLKLPGNAKQANAATTVPTTHIVKRGDSLSRISAKYNVTIRAIKSMNGLRSNTLIPGQKLKISAAAGNSRSAAKEVVKKPTTHKVRRGDTLSEIAEKYGSSQRKIMRANNMRSRTVMLGQVLKIPG